VALAVDSVGGPVVARLLELLSDGDGLVSYSWARTNPCGSTPRHWSGKHLTVRGFFVATSTTANKVVPVIREAAPLVPTAPSLSPVAGVYPLEHIQDAVQHLLRGGKILLKVAGR